MIGLKNIKNKKRSTLTQFDIVPKKNEPRKECTNIPDEEIEIILACWKSILADNRRTWVKSHVDNFDVPMGANELAQIAHLEL